MFLENTENLLKGICYIVFTKTRLCQRCFPGGLSKISDLTLLNVMVFILEIQLGQEVKKSFLIMVYLL